MAASVGRISATSNCYCTANQSLTGVSVGLVMGDRLFLRHMLVAHLSDNPLRAPCPVAGISAPVTASRIRAHFPRPVQRPVGSISRAFCFRGALSYDSRLVPRSRGP